MGLVVTEARPDPDVVLGDVLEHDDLLVERALADETLAHAERPGRLILENFLRLAGIPLR